MSLKALIREYASLQPRKPKPVHRATLIRSDGKVSPLCAKRPRVLNLARETWTNRDAAVTCRRCLAAMKAARS